MKCSERWRDVWGAYSVLFAQVLIVDANIAHRAIELREVTISRLPTVDSLIAAAASVYGCTLVHRDPHLGAIPASELNLLELPNR
jgi:predicted nucleic acid-binding protein